MILTVVLTAWWRNNDPVDGPALTRTAGDPGDRGGLRRARRLVLGRRGSATVQRVHRHRHGRLGNGCHRSTAAYSQLLRFEGPTPAQRFVACSGAVTSDVFNQFTVRDKDGNTIVVPPQVAPGVHPRGRPRDDHHRWQRCGVLQRGHPLLPADVIAWSRSSSRRRQPGDEDQRLPRPLALDDVGASRRSARCKAKMHRLYPSLRSAFPNARIIVIGYPYLFPERDAPYWNLTDCQTILRTVHTRASGPPCDPAGSTEPGRSTMRLRLQESSSSRRRRDGRTTSRVARVRSSTPTRSSRSSCRPLPG